MNKHKAGVYTITTPSGRVYVGSAIDVNRRLREHRNDLKKLGHKNKLLQNVANKYGVDNLKFEKVLSVPVIDAKTLVEYENLMLKYIEPKLRLNAAPVAGSTLGYRFTAEQRARHAAGVKARYESDPAYRARVSLAMSAVMAQPETKEKIAAAVSAARARPESKERYDAARVRPEYRAKHAAAIAASHARPEYREKVSVSVKATWGNEVVRAARNVRHGTSVTVNGVTILHTSVYAAFRHYELPICQHQKFRLKLKASGKDVFEQDGRVYAFELV
jgi:group I intron endonuclease